MKPVALVVLCGAFFVSCSKAAPNPAAPSKPSLDVLQADPITIYSLHVNSSSLEETVDSLGHYLYKSTTSVRNLTGTPVTVTNYQVVVWWGVFQTVAAIKSTAQDVLVPAYSSRTIVFTFNNGSVRLFTNPNFPVRYQVKIGFKDKYGNTGSVSSAKLDLPGCPGCWDYIQAPSDK